MSLKSQRRPWVWLGIGLNDALKDEMMALTGLGG
jgi:hypothetical protein